MPSSLFFASTYVGLWLVVFLLVASVFYLARQVGLLYLRVGPIGARMTNVGPAIGTVAPPREVESVGGDHFMIGGERDRPQLIMFLTAKCSNCRDLAPSLRTIARGERGNVDVVILSKDSEEAHRHFIRLYRLEAVANAISEEVVMEYGLTVTPYAVLLGPSGQVLTKGIVNNIAQLESVLNAADQGVSSLEEMFVRPGGKAMEESNDGA